MVEIIESGMTFGPFAEDDVFYIEKSESFSSLGEGFKTVEFVYLRNKTGYILVEAKTTCPNKANALDDSDKLHKYKEYFDDIQQKFEDSVNLFAATVLGLHSQKGVGNSFQRHIPFKSSSILLILVIGQAEEQWTLGPKAELEERMKRFRKMWNAEILVLNRMMAIQQGLIKQEV